MAYLTDTNDKILVFVNRAQTKIGAVSVLLADKVSEDSRFETYRDEVELAYGLLSFIRSLDNNFNDWTEPEIVQYIDKWTAKANLNALPYIDHADFNNQITFFVTNTVSSGGSTLHSWDMSTDLFPAKATFGYRAYGINGPTGGYPIGLADRFGDPIPDGSFIECIKVSGIASTTDPLDWAIYTTIISA